MKPGWEQRALSEVCSFENGDRGKNYPGKKAFVPVGVPFINAGHLDGGAIDWDGMDYIPEDRFKQLGSGKIRKGDLLFCLRGSLGKFGVVKRETMGAIASSLVIVRPNSQLDRDFLAHYFRSSLAKEMVDKFAGGAAQPNLSAKSLKAFRIPLPPFEEQQAIVATLDKAFEGLDRARKNAGRNLESARELFASILNGALTSNASEKMDWEVKPIGQIADHCLGKMLDKNKNKGTPKPYLRNLNVRWFDFDLTDILEMKFEDREVDRYTARKGDLLVCEGGYPGRAAIWDQDTPIFFQKALHRVRFHEPQRNKWFLYYLLKCDLDGSLKNHFTGSGIQHFTGKSLARFTMPVPPLEEQQQIIARLDGIKEDIDNIDKQYCASLENLDQLRQTILQKAFAGELV